MEVLSLFQEAMKETLHVCAMEKVLAVFMLQPIPCMATTKWIQWHIAEATMRLLELERRLDTSYTSYIRHSRSSGIDLQYSSSGSTSLLASLFRALAPSNSS